MRSTLLAITVSIIMAATSAVAGDDDSDSDSDAGQETRSYKVAQGDPAFLPSPQPPWDVGPLPGGFSANILNAICDANKEMECEIVVRSYADCLFTDFTEPTTVGIGPVLLGEEIVGCLTWVKTNPRTSRGIVFTNPYSNTSAPGSIGSAILSSNELVNIGNSLAFANGFASDLTCATAAGYAYTVAEPVLGNAAAIASVDSDTDAIVQAGDLLMSLPAGVFIATTLEVDGTTPIRCGVGIRVIAYPSGTFEDTHNFISDFNCGLSLIARNGTYEEICASFAPDSSVAPFCFDPSEIALPTKACRKLENDDNDNSDSD